MTSPQFVTFLERKLKEHGIAKVVPGEDELAEAYKFFRQNLDIEKVIERELKQRKTDEDAIEVPDDLAEQVRKILSTRSQLRWDSALYKVAGGRLKAEKSKPKRASKKLKPSIDIAQKLDEILGEGWHEPLAHDEGGAA